ncbi:hypothetical protein SMB34_05745 [Thalassospira permensis NBRC 106175]|uniref:Uncharacterized protein n=1 Tax=Thalassospira permensis NBRC 106175 TaxID=1353532 RepID=A0ABR4TK74_9PROT|nr:hypothetical protein SMB34_05745 [Thalassospira permensis NBRC 106175]
MIICIFRISQSIHRFYFVSANYARLIVKSNAFFAWLEAGKRRKSCFCNENA